MLSVLPPTKGREDVGHRSTAVIHGRQKASEEAASTSVRRIRADHPDVPMTTANARAGVTMSAASILVLNPSPTNAPASTNHRMGRSLSSARSTAQAAATRNRMRNGSGRFRRLTEAVTGLKASTTPATVAAPTPNRRRTVTQSTPTLAAPATALGRRRLQLE